MAIYVWYIYYFKEYRKTLQLINRPNDGTWNEVAPPPCRAEQLWHRKDDLSSPLLLPGKQIRTRIPLEDKENPKECTRSNSMNWLVLSILDTFQTLLNNWHRSWTKPKHSSDLSASYCKKPALRSLISRDELSREGDVDIKAAHQANNGNWPSIRSQNASNWDILNVWQRQHLLTHL